ncbi:hypothetical protein BC332_24496 [Capsicum chinense]|nr:hypothetical protein BC332_24496 [Capsicum chinense]
MAFHCMFLLAIFLVFPLSTIAQSYKNVSLGSTLTTSDVTKFWPSPSGDFAFGFQRIRNGSSGFLLAIWFNKLEGKTIVWSANRNNIAPEGSKVELSIDGRLVLTDPNGQEIWARDMASAGPAYGAMLDTGLSRASLARMHRVEDLRCSWMEIWRFIRSTNGTLLTLISSSNETNSTSSQFYQRAILESDGAFRHYVYPKRSSSGRRMAWSSLHSVPDNICLLLPQHLEREGVACGFNSLCSMGTDRRPRCDCPIKYILNDPKDKLGSCSRNFPEQDCKDESHGFEAFTMHEMLHTNWIGSDYEY